MPALRVRVYIELYGAIWEGREEERFLSSRAMVDLIKRREREREQGGAFPWNMNARSG